MRQEKGNNLCGYYVCDFIHSLVGHNKQMTAAELEVRKNNLLPLFHVPLSHCICRKHSYLTYNIMFFFAFDRLWRCKKTSCRRTKSEQFKNSSVDFFWRKLSIPRTCSITVERPIIPKYSQTKTMRSDNLIYVHII